MFTVWTLTARFRLGVKSNDSRTVWRTPWRFRGAFLNAGDSPDGEREAAFSSGAARIPRRPHDQLRAELHGRDQAALAEVAGEIKKLGKARTYRMMLECGGNGLNPLR